MHNQKSKEIQPSLFGNKHNCYFQRFNKRISQCIVSGNFLLVSLESSDDTLAIATKEEHRKLQHNWYFQYEH